MPKISKRNLQSRQANQVSINMRQQKRIIHNINQMLTQMNDDELQLIYQNITQPNEINDKEVEINDKEVETNNKKMATNARRQKLIKIIKICHNNLNKQIKILIKLVFLFPILFLNLYNNL